MLEGLSVSVGEVPTVLVGAPADEVRWLSEKEVIATSESVGDGDLPQRYQPMVVGDLEDLGSLRGGWKSVLIAVG